VSEGLSVTSDSLEAHLQVKRYGDFTLTDAVRPALEVPIRPREGYRLEVFRDQESRLRLPMIFASVSAEKLFDTFLALLEPLGDTLHVVLESSHGRKDGGHVDFRRNKIDAPVLASHFCDFEDLILNDGCTGIAVLSARGPMEVQFDEHKLFAVYAPKVGRFRRALKEMGVRRRRVLPMLCEAEHLHYSNDDYADQFEQLALRLGVADFESVPADGIE
jgi:hypothetical protein